MDQYQTKNLRNLKIFAGLTLCFEVFIILMYGLFIRFAQIPYYSVDFIQDVSLCLLCLVGFGLILSYLKNIQYSALAFNLLILAFVFQYYFLVNAFWTKAQVQATNSIFANSDKTYVGMAYGPNAATTGFQTNDQTVYAAFKCGLAIIVAFSAVLGRAGPLQALIMSIVGVIFYQLNSQILSRFAFDRGGSIKIFAFGGIFGFVTAYWMNNQHNLTTYKHKGYRYDRWSATLALIGTLFCWALFPSLQNIQTSGNLMKVPAFINSMIALAGSGLSAVFTSVLFKDRVGLSDLIYGSIAGGVSIATSANIIVNPAAALVVGINAGFFQILFRNKIENFFTKDNIIDSYQTLSLFGISGLLGGIWSAIFTGFQLNSNTTQNNFSGFSMELSSNGGNQFGAVLMAIGFGSISGLICGLLFKSLNPVITQNQYIDSTYFDEADDGISYKRIQLNIPKQQYQELKTGKLLIEENEKQPQKKQQNDIKEKKTLQQVEDTPKPEYVKEPSIRPQTQKIIEEIEIKPTYDSRLNQQEQPIVELRKIQSSTKIDKIVSSKIKGRGQYM